MLPVEALTDGTAALLRLMKLQKLFRRTASGEQPDSFSEVFRQKYFAFQQLLAKNNSVLRLMADMEEKLSGEYLFDDEYIHSSVRLIARGVLCIIENLNILSSGDTYSVLHRRFYVINGSIENILQQKFEVPVSGLTIPLDNINGDMANVAGDEMTRLGAVKTALSLPTPEGFVISAYAFKRFMEHNRFLENTNRMISALSVHNLKELQEVSKEIQDTIIRSASPDDMAAEIRNAYADLCRKTGKETAVSVRSSAVHEVGHFSFAGQYATFLNVAGDSILERYKEVVASLFAPRAILYYKTKGFSEEEMVMAVGVLGMVDAKASGAVYTRDANEPLADHMIVHALCGFGKFMEDGTTPTCSYTVSRQPERGIIGRSIFRRETKASTKHCFTDGQIGMLAGYALEIENYYGCPQDVEWAIDRDNTLYVLRARPLRLLFGGQIAGVCPARRIKGRPILIERGVIASKGIGFGKAFLLRNEEDLKHFPEGAVLVARHTDPKYVTVMHKASAIITDVGSATGHLASLAREYQVPAILNTEVATEVIRHGRELTVDAIHCNIYEGKVTELLEHAPGKKEPLKETFLFKRLEMVMKKIVPLNLTDPDASCFKPEHCETLHDITRFAREKAIQAMSSIVEGYDIKSLSGTVKLVTDIPVAIHLFDIGGGISPKVKKPTPADILSIPFSAILKGMGSMKWPKPRLPEGKGFSSVHAQASSLPAKQQVRTGGRNFSIVAVNYMNFSVRLGYHFSTIEAYASETVNDNYIAFSFKGGGSSLDRRLRRARLIQEILEKLGFAIHVEGDVVKAVLAKYKQSTMEDTLCILGKLTAYTKQLDAVLYNDAVTDMYIEQFVNEHVKKTVNSKQ
ncbi:MAG: PEP/pyruvate-binding domain-containing protein [Nitrospirota bacterium]